MSSQAHAVVAAPGSIAASITVNVFDGTRELYSGAKPILITVRDGNQNQVSRDFFNLPSVHFEGVRVFQNLGDNYTVIASVNGFKDAGFFPVKIGAGIDRVVDLLLLPNDGTVNFAQAKWSLLGSRPTLKKLLAAGAADDASAAQRYSNLMEADEGLISACLLNITTAMSQIQLPQGTPLDYLKEIIWDTDKTTDTHIAQDRFFGWADPALIDQVKRAKQEGEFADAPFILHPGATSSYKQIQFGEANVQLTFHENSRKEINGTSCVLVEPDIDYFKDAGSHLLLEVVVNGFGSLTDPRTVYALRWMAGRQAGFPEFDPLYTIENS